MSNKSHRENLIKLAAGMALCFALAFALHPWIPFIKHVGTASFVLYSLGGVLFMLIGFYWLMEVRGYGRWTFPLVVVGMNSIFIYSLSVILVEWLDHASAFHFSLQFHRNTRSRGPGMHGPLRHAVPVLLAVQTEHPLEALSLLETGSPEAHSCPAFCAPDCIGNG